MDIISNGHFQVRWLVLGIYKMCLILFGIFSYLSYVFYIDNEFLNASINAIIAFILIVLLIKNIVKSRKYIKNKKNKI